jgi:hypothetical protein
LIPTDALGRTVVASAWRPAPFTGQLDEASRHAVADSTAAAIRG